jgi:tetratricopeptide (TPR) repeat protein
MYGNKIKSAEEKAVDKEYVEFMLTQHNGDTIKAAKTAARDGWHFFYKQVIDTAMFRFNQSWLIDSTYSASYFGFAALKEFQGQNKEAENYFNIAYEHDPTDSLIKKYLHQIAQIREQHKDTLELINSYYRVLSKFPKDDVATGKLGFFYSALHKRDSALKYYNMTIVLNPSYEQTYLNRAWLFYQEGKFHSAIEDYTTVIGKNKQSIYAYANRSNILMDIKQYELAVADINHCIELDPKHPTFHFAKAECYHQLKQHKNACEEIKIGIAKGGKYTDKLKEYKCE